ncbi:caspase family protein [Bradyrhizobium rifense]|uniref:Caspase family protein n=1 Tax=Bradyrhizobium rifense TaxID=515499 RepID=A0A5D3KNA7_9BRAD|nr:caspase family protein [Bradyrhizobium rifense]TYL97554.1 caspase family protein [Bradyrhizobium rifense]
MAQARFASLAIGIDEYPQGFYQGDELPLKCASADARRVHAWVSDTFPREQSRHFAFFNAQATHLTIKSSLETLATLQNLDFVLIYLAGHGRRTANGANFCAYDHPQVGQGVDAHFIDDALRRMQAKNVLIFVDCCHAEAVFWGSEFFSRLEGSRCRLFVASCQADQLAYEDDLLKSATDASGSSLLALALFEKIDEAARLRSEHLSLDEALFPYLKRRVPALAFNLKGRAPQEPVSGGLSRDNIYLPIAPSTRPPPGTFTALLARWRSVVTTICVIAAFSIVTIYAATWHLEFSSKGYLALFAGPSWLPSLPGDLLLRSELPFTVADITEEPSLRAAALSRKIEGMWWQTDRFGQRRWLQVIEGALRPGIRAYTRALNGMPQEAAPDLNLINPESFDFKRRGAGVSRYSSMLFGPRPMDIDHLIAIGASAVLDHPTDMDGLIRPVVQHKDLATFNSNACATTISYEYLEWGKGDFWQSLSLSAARADAPELFDFLIFQARVLDLILRAEPPRPESPESDPLDYIVISAAKLRHLIRSYALGRRLRNETALAKGDADKVSELKTSGCGTMADILLAWLEEEKADPELPARILDDLTTPPVKYGKRSDTVVKLLLGAFEEICHREAIKDTSKGWSLLSQVPQSVSAKDRLRMAVRLAADRGFPGELEDALFQTVERWPNRIAADKVPPMWAQLFSEALSRPDRALQTLSVGAAKMSSESKQRFLRLDEPIERIAKTNGMESIAPGLDAYAEGLSWLGPLRKDISDYIFHGETTEGRDQIKSLVDLKLGMLARMASRGYQDPRMKEELFDLPNPIPGINLSDWRGFLAPRAYVDWMLAARAEIRYRQDPPTPEGLLRLVSSLRGDARRRRSEVLIVQEYLRDRPVAEKKRWVTELSALAATEIEPELRADIASLAVRVFASIELEDLNEKR